MSVAYVDIAAQHGPLREELLEAVASVLDSGQFILGPQVEAFEEAFAELCGVRHAVGVNSGTDALVLALRVLDIGPGDEVITASNSFVATAGAVRLVGATVVFADVGEDMNLDPARVAQAIGPRTRAIIPVHLTGRPCEMDALLELAGERIAIVEDAAQAVGAEFRGRRVGSFGHLGCFSLHPLKNLNACGDGGVVTTDDDALAERLRRLRNLGLQGRDDCLEWSGNSRLDAMQAALLMVKLRHLEGWTERRRAHARRYTAALEGAPGVTALPIEGTDRRCVYHTFVLRSDRREELRAALARRSIGSAVHYPTPIHLMTAGRELGYARGSLPVTEHQAREILSLPVHQDLTDADIDEVAATVVELSGRLTGARA